MEAISLKLDENMLVNIDKSLKKHNYSTRTEFIREAIRNKLNEVEKEEAIRKIAAFKGSLKGKSKMSYEEARRRASVAIAEKFGIDLD